MQTTSPDLTRCWHCRTTEGVEIYINHVDRGAEIALCMTCLMRPYAREPELTPADIALTERRDAELQQWHRSREAAGLSPWP